MGVFITCGGGSYTSGKFLNVYPEVEPCVLHGVTTLPPDKAGQIMNIRYSTQEFCSICHDSYEESSGHDAVRLDCQHAFGRKCIIHWALKKNICPVCRLETIPAEFSGGESVFRRLANRTISGLAPRQKIGLLIGLFVGLSLGLWISVDCDLHSTSGNGVGKLLFYAAAAAIISTFDVAPYPSISGFCSIYLGKAIGLGLSALIILIVNTPGQS